MKFVNDSTEICIPDGHPLEAALDRVTHLGIGAHQDDLEFMAFHGILNCYENPGQWFGGITCTNGSGCSRTGPFADITDQEMQAIRKKEQNQAAHIGQYAAMIQLDYPSHIIKDPANHCLSSDISKILQQSKPDVVYTHNPADKHDTHIAVLTETLHAIRSLPKTDRPKQVLGCEVWRGLDWMLDEDKVPMDVSGNDELAEALNSVFASQIAGGKRYDLATIGRRQANATFFEAHGSDESNLIWFAMDLTPLVLHENLDIVDYVDGYIQRFTQDIQTKLNRYSPNTGI